MKELIEQIGGREALEEMAQGNWPDSGFRDKGKTMARALLAVLDAKPVGYIDAEYAELLKSGHIESCSANAEIIEGCIPFYTTPPAASGQRAGCVEAGSD